ncbi:hypothetical protein [Psychroflexus montanilacus]|uniref:hypothetical protein n=1 Tax=Psychroflexus montanilacus TaxID=2873598 RepID=UPI001CCA3D7D|nr:hypothetical protein [Psychroflexus montanilacus]MBZ9652868.1 hypothetical protein [Psychroflexus montanilacus]
MEIIRGEGDIFHWDWSKKPSTSDYGCMVLGLAAGVVTVFNPHVGGLTVIGCMLTK